MSFIADQQTLGDLALLGKYNPHSVFNIFNKVKTRGGEKLLDLMFQHPLTDPTLINERSKAFRYYHNHTLQLPFGSELTDRVEAYLDESGEGSLIASVWKTWLKRIMASFVRDEAYGQLSEGIDHCVDLLTQCTGLLQQLQRQDSNEHAPWAEWATILQCITSDSRVKKALDKQRSRSVMATARLHFLFSSVFQEAMRRLLALTYELDVQLTVSTIARQKKFAYAGILMETHSVLQMQDLRHPSLDNAVANTLSFDKKGNTLFLTGANMAGKSTLMKSAGIAVYLAHMGFPVPCSAMQFTVLEGLYSSVNLPDDLNRGYSHFYAEVLRVKMVAQAVASGKKLFVIFDELFKGTNVKDAYDATLDVTAAFASFRKSSFIISTHIIEVGEGLAQKDGTIRFVFMPTVMEGTVPRYTYQLQQGITEDRQGMVILENEGILRML